MALEQSGVQLTAEGANAYIRDLTNAANANKALDQSAQQTAKGFDTMASSADKIKLQSLNNQLADQKNRLTALSAELEKQGNAYDFTSKKALSTAVAYQRVEGQADVTEARIAALYAELSKPAPPPIALPEPKPYNPNLGGAVRELTHVADSADTATRSLNLMERELGDMKSSFSQNTARINDLRSALQLASISTEQDEKANNALEKELHQLIATNDKLTVSIEKRSIALDKAKTPKTPQTPSAKPDTLPIANIGLEVKDQESGIKSFIGTLGGLASAYIGLEAAATFAMDGLRLGAELEQSRLTIQTLVGSVEKGNAIYAEAIAFGQKYGYTQQEMASAAAQAATIINKTNLGTEKTLEVLGRLASLNPAEGFEGAVVAFKELTSGDIVSIAERFNIAKTEANAMKDAILAGADPVKVLDDALAKMNVTSDVLANRMKGTNGALLDVKLAFEDAKLATGEFLTAIGAPEMLQNFATGLKFVTDKVREYVGLMKQAQGINPATGEKQAMATTGLDATSYQAYQEQTKNLALSQAQADLAIQERNRNLGFLGDILNTVALAQDAFSDKTLNGSVIDRQLTQDEFALAQAFIQRGVGQDQAAVKAIQLGQATSQADNALAQLSGTEAVTAEQSKALQDQIIALAMEHPNYTDQIFTTINAQLEQGATSDELSTAIQTLSDDLAYNQVEQNRLEGAALLTAQATDTHTASVYELSAAQWTDIEAKLTAAEAAEKQAQWEQDLAWAVDASQGSALDAAGAALYLSQAYGIEYSQAVRLLSATNALNEARAGRVGVMSGRGVADALAGAIDYNQGRREGRITAPYNPEKKKGGGKKAGKSEEVKAAEKREKELAKIEKKIADEKAKYEKKREEATKAHLARLAVIEAEYQRKSLEAEKKFNTDKFNVRNGFKSSILDLDKELWDAARAEEVGYWNESQVIAQSGDAKRAEDFYAAAQEYTSLKAQHAQDLRDIDQEIANSTDAAEIAQLEEKKRRLQEIYAEQELLAKENLDKLRNGENELAKERDEAIKEENADYDNANQELEDSYRETVAELIEDSGDLKTAVADMVSALIPSFASLAQAARDAAAAAGSVPSGDTAVTPVPAMASGGYIAKNRPVLVGDKPGGRLAPHTEMFVPKTAGTILPADVTRSIVATPQQIYNRSQTRMANTTNTITNNYNLGVQTNNSPRAVEQSFYQMEARSK